MATFGGVSCSYCRGDSRGPITRVETWIVPGIDGCGAQDLGDSDSEFRFELVLYGTAAGLRTWKAQIEALQGSVITVVDDKSVSHTYLLLEQVSQMETSAAVIPGTTTVVRGTIVATGKKIA